MTSWALVVAADERRRRRVTAELEQAGFEVETVVSVEAALALLSVMRPSLIVADPGIAGLERLRVAARPAEPDNGRAIPMVDLLGALA